jgi:hypothetical protein
MVEVVPKWNFVPVMGILEEGGFYLGKTDKERRCRFHIGNCEGLRDGTDFFGLCFMSNHLGCEFQFGT